MQKEIRKELEGMGEPAGRQAGTSIGDSLKKWGRRGAIAAGGAIAAVAGTALVKGFGRLTALENAEATLRGLGHSAETVTEIMDNALQSVLGTSFGMDEAAGLAATMVAAGIEPGQELERILTLAGDAATIAGTDLNDMGMIWGKVAAKGRVDGQVVNQMLERQIPILDMLGDHYGVTAAEAADMVSEGKVSFEDFAATMETSVGGAAQESGNTTQGAFKNMGAALGRVGANMLSGVFPKFKEAFSGITNWLGPIEERAKEVGEALGEWLGRAAEAIGNFIQEFRDGEGAGGKFRDVLEAVWGVLQGTFNFVKDTVVPVIQSLWTWLTENKDVVFALGVGLLAAFAAFKAIMIVKSVATAIKVATAAVRGFNLALLANPIGIVVAAIGLLVAGFVLAWQRSETFRDIVTGAWNGIKSAVSAAWEWMKGVFESIKDAFASVASWFSSRGDDISGAWDSVKNSLKRGWDWIKKNVFDRVTAGLDRVGKWFSDTGDDIRRAWDSVKNALKAGYDFIKRHTFDRMVDGMQITWNFFKGRVDDIRGAWDSLKVAFRAVWDWIDDNVIQRFRRGVDNIAGWVSDAVGNIDRAWRGIANKFRDPINWVINTVWNDGIARVFNNVADAIGISTRLSRNAAIPRFAEGGYHKGGWALVGEEGPELVNFDRPGRVYTATETAQALAAGRDLSPAQSRAAAGRTPGEALAPMGGNWLSRAWSAATSWVRGGLASLAESILNPITSRIGSTMGQWGSTGDLFGDTMLSAKDRLLDWIRGKDDEAPEIGGSGWVRPSRGPVTSRFGPRWGGIHSGIDVAGGGPTFAAAAGEVLRTGWNILTGRTGIGIILQHAKDLFTYYGHNPPGGVVVRPGQSVTAGQRIGAQGATGNVTGVHVHFELHKGGLGRAVNPEQLGVFDSGGWLKPGMLAANMSSRPEPVLTGSQWHDIHSLATSDRGIDGAHITGRLEIGGDGLATIIDGRMSASTSGIRRTARAHLGGVR